MSITKTFLLWGIEVVALHMHNGNVKRSGSFVGVYGAVVLKINVLR